MAESKIIITGERYKLFRKPVVYIWKRGEAILYVGCSVNGFGRVLSHAHHVIDNKDEVRADDMIEVIICKDREEVRKTETLLIESLRPKYNSGQLWDVEVDRREQAIEKRIRKENRVLRTFTSPELSPLVKKILDSKTIPDFKSDETKLFISQFVEEMKLKYKLAGDLRLLARVNTNQEVQKQEEIEMNEFDKLLLDLDKK